MAPRAPVPLVAAVVFGALLACTGLRQPAPAPVAEAPADPSGGTASSAPPAGLLPVEVPQFVVFGFDDNGTSGMPGSPTTGGVRFVVDLFAGRRNPAGRGKLRTYDGTPALTSFYIATRYLERPEADLPEHMKRALRAAADGGHEIALHTHQHAHGAEFTSAQWGEEIAACRQWLTRPFAAERAADETTGLGVAPAELIGFRAPFLEYGPPLFPALRAAGLDYDCSVEVGFGDGYDGRDLPWPYKVAAGYGEGAGAAGNEEGRELWELPVYALTVPPDAECLSYGVQPGLRDRLHQVHDYFDPADGKITGFDWNLWVAFQMSAPEVVATLRYTLDQRLAGNRAPLTFGTHSDIYSEQYEGITGSTAEERRAALTQILEDALARPEVRVVTGRQLLDWLRVPAPL